MPWVCKYVPNEWPSDEPKDGYLVYNTEVGEKSAYGYYPSGKELAEKFARLCNKNGESSACREMGYTLPQRKRIKKKSMNLKEVYDWYVKAGYLKGIERDDLTLYNYTTQCVMKGNWNYHTRCARGLILDSDGKFIARPFQKFFGLYEREETYIQNLPDEEAEIATKYDGSLVIVFQNPNLSNNAWDAVTRGCWDNEQIRFARRWLKDNAAKLEPGYTYCFELTAPWNQVVIPYEEEKMTFLGRIDPYGLESSYAEAVDYAKEHGLEPVEFFIGKVDEVNLVNLPWDCEGYVARFPNGLRVKMKAPHYEERHKELT